MGEKGRTRREEGKCLYTKGACILILSLSSYYAITFTHLDDDLILVFNCL